MSNNNIATSGPSSMDCMPIQDLYNSRAKVAIFNSNESIESIVWNKLLDDFMNIFFIKGRNGTLIRLMNTNLEIEMINLESFIGFFERLCKHLKLSTDQKPSLRYQPKSSSGWGSGYITWAFPTSQEKWQVESEDYDEVVFIFKGFF